MDISRKMTEIAYHALDEKLAVNINVIDISNVTSIADYFIIAAGNNPHQVQALADNVTEALGRAGYEPRQIEGYQTARWILLDYRDVVIHIFHTEDRDFYDLERIWRDGKLIDNKEFDKEEK